MKLKRDAKFGEESTWFQNWQKEFDKFWSEHPKVSLIFTLMGFFWAKYMSLKLEKVRRSYISWKWRAMQNLERNRPVVSRLAQGIWQVLTWAFKSFKDFRFNGLLLSKVYIVEAENVHQSYLLWNGRGMQNLVRNRLCSKIDIRNLTNFDLTTQKFH